MTALDEGKDRPKEAIQALRSEAVDDLEAGLGVLHVAACKGSLEVCKYLVEHLQFDTNEPDNEGLYHYKPMIGV